jgi:hypothetical protein
MSEFTIIVEHMVEKSGRRSGSRYLIADARMGDVIEANDIDHAWTLARQKYYLGKPRSMMQIVDIVPGNIEVRNEEATGDMAQPPPKTNGGTEPTVPGGDSDR